VIYSDSEIAIHAENFQAGRVAAAFYQRHEQALLAYGRKCGEEELAREVLVDALMEWWREKRAGAELQPPLAVSWRRARSPGPLRAFLQRCIRTRTADRQRQADRIDSLDGYASREVMVAPRAPAPDGVRLARACECWETAVRELAIRLPRATICWWLTTLCARQAKALLKLLYPARGGQDAGGAEWRENPGTVNRMLEQYERERAAQLDRARVAAGLTNDDLDEARERFAASLFWGELPGRPRGPVLKKTEQTRLAMFAGGLPVAQRKETIAWLVQSPNAVRQLALYLPAQGTRERAPELDPTALSEAVIFPADPVLAGRRGSFHTEARRRSGAMTAPELLVRLGSAVSRVFDCLLASIGAESGTLWLRQGSRLAAVLNPREHEVPGLSVPAHLGFVHQCLREEKPLAVQPGGARDGARHFTEIDARLGRPVHAMVAAPYRHFGEAVGVVTAVRFGPGAAPFSAGHLADAVCFGNWAGGLLESRLEREAARRVREVEAHLKRTIEAVLRECEPAALARALGLGTEGGSAAPADFPSTRATPNPVDANSGPSWPVLKRLFGWILAEAGADSGTLWLRSGDCLEAVLNPLEPAMAGQRQPLREGIIGNVFLTGRAEVAADVQADSRYAARVDREVSGRSTQSMVTVPLSLFGRRSGVVTLVRQTPGLGPLTDAARKQARLLAVLLQRHLEDALRFRLMDPAPGLD
jgi:hypothetical protein